ncbi:MAG: PfkB family carbohydrate kinase [Solirubrobacteraceae bacterium]
MGAVFGRPADRGPYVPGGLRTAASTDPVDLVTAARQLQLAGAKHVLISHGSAPALLIDDGGGSARIELAPPVFEALDRRGTGDSMFAATGAGLARGMSMIDALRLGMAAGALNATRRGLGTGTRDAIERLAAHVTVESGVAAGGGGADRR